MQWNDKMHRSRIEKWISENPISSPPLTFDKIEDVRFLKSKTKCIHYDYKKGLCGNLDNPLFNQLCDNAPSCHYYSEKIVYITSKDKLRSKLCLCCELQAEYEYLEVSYSQSKNSLSTTKKLQILRCNHCHKDFINVDLYKNYAKNKNPDYIDVKFTEFKK